MATDIKTSWQDMLATEGIMSRGYGIIPKFTMVDHDLSITAKAIYAYLCSLAGTGDSAYPSVSNVTHVLQINKDTYYKHFAQLTEAGYVTIEKNRNAGKFENNIYVLASNPKKFKLTSDLNNNGKLYSTIGFTGIKQAGFGCIPRGVMQDDRLSVKAKTLYAYFCSFAGAVSAAFPKRNDLLYHLHISQNTYLTALRELTTFGYVVVKQRVESGRFSVNDYYLIDKVCCLQQAVERPCIKFSDTVNSDKDKPDVVNREVAHPEMADSDKQNPETKESDNTIQEATIINHTINSPAIKSPSINSHVILLDGEKMPVDEAWDFFKQTPKIEQITRMIDRQDIENCILNDLALDVYQSENKDRIKYLVSLAAEAIHSYQSLKVGGVSHPRADFVPKLIDNWVEEYEFVIRKVDSIQGIQNLKAYYLAALYNAKADYEAEIRQEIASQFF